LRPSASRMRPFDRRMHPSASRMRPSDKHMRPSDNRMHPTVFCMRPLCRHMRPSASVCAPQPACSNPDHLTWQRCGRDVAATVDIDQSRFILSKVNKTLILIGRTRTLSDMTDGRTRRDGRTHRQPYAYHILKVK
jgi:hypothetical protein